MKLFNVMILVLLAPAVGWAVPVKFAACAKNVKLQTPKNSSGVFFNETCDTAYVLPPQVGTLKIFNLVPTGDLANTCQQYTDTEAAISAITSSLKLHALLIESYAKKIQEYSENLEEGLLPVGMTADQMEEKIDELLTKMNDKQNAYLESIENLRASKVYFAKAEGATGKFYLVSELNKLVSEYQKKNPSIQFFPMPLEQSYISINQKSANATDSTDFPLEAVKSIVSAQIGYMPLLTQIRDPQNTPPTIPEISGDIFTQGQDGDIVLSALGACPLFNSSGLPKDISLKALETYISANVVYQYHLQILRKHSITYNLGQLAKRIETSSKKGGFLSRKNVHSLIEESNSKKWITFEMYTDDPSYNYTAEYRDEIKQQFLNSVLAEVAYVSFDNPGNYPSLVEPTGQSGAGVAADALGKCPHMYCQVGMYALKFIDSTFGKTTAISNYIKTRDVWAQETVKEQQMVPYVGSYTFK